MGTTTLLDAALDYAARGWAVFPLLPRSKIPPKGSHGWHDATTDPDRIRQWWTETPDANVAMAPGLSGLVAVDMDPRHGGDRTWSELTTELGEEVAHTLTNQTGSGGRHFLYRQNGRRVKTDDATLGPGVDTIGQTGYIILPPSIHPNGQPYRWAADLGPDDLDPVEVPPALNALLPEYVERTRPEVGDNAQRTLAVDTDDAGAFWLTRALERVQPGTRNASGFWLACQLRDAGLGQDDAGGILRDYADRVGRLGDHDYTHAEALASLAQAYTAGARDPARSAPGSPTYRDPEPWPDYDDGPLPTESVDLNDFHRTETGNAEAMAALFGDRLRFAHDPPSRTGGTKGLWLVWSGHRWAPCDAGTLDRFAKATARRRQAAALNIEDEKKRTEAMGWAMGSESAYRRRTTADLARVEHPIAARFADFDTDPWLLGCENGVLDLRTGTLRPGRRSDMLTKSVGYDYDPSAACPRWERFLLEVFAGDLDLVAFLRRAVGYSLTGDIREQCLFLCHGSGANGKTTLLTTLRAALGNYATNTPFSTFEYDRRTTSTNDVAALASARLVTAAETSEARRLNEARVKAVTGGDPVTARFLFSEFFTFTPGFKVWLAMNALPKVVGTDEGIWRRIRLVPFNVAFKGDDADKALDAQLRAELPGILAWAVEGCLDWQRAGDLVAPTAVVDATAAYRAESDMIGRFLSESTMALETGTVRASDLYRAYGAWCDDAGEKAVSGTAFGRRLADMGFEKTRKRSGVFYDGLALVVDERV